MLSQGLRDEPLSSSEWRVLRGVPLLLAELFRSPRSVQAEAEGILTHIGAFLATIGELTLQFA
jgi:hypothetical protein